jgi:hypothetical protein
MPANAENRPVIRFDANDRAIWCSGGTFVLEPVHFFQASGAHITLFEVADTFHRSAKNAAGPVSFQYDMVSLDQNFYRIPFIHLITFAERFRQHNTPQLIHFPYYACRFQHLFLPFHGLSASK